MTKLGYVVEETKGSKTGIYFDGAIIQNQKACQVPVNSVLCTLV